MPLVPTTPPRALTDHDAWAAPVSAGVPASRRDGVHRIAALLFLWGSVVIGGLVLAGFAATALVLFYLTVVSQW